MSSRSMGTWAIPLMMMGASMVSGQDFPNRIIRIVATEAGGGNDFVARTVAQGLNANLRQQAIVDNRPGANGIIAAQTVIKAPPDGYTLLNYSNGLWILPLLQKVPYDPVNDFSPVTITANSPNILVVHSSLPVKSVRELIALAKGRRGEINYGVGAAGSTPHLATEMFKMMAGIEITHVAYKSSGSALTALLTGEVQLVFATGGSLAPHIKSGRLRPLAVTSLQPTPLAPEVPTLAATLPGYEASSTYCIFAPVKTPEPIINRLNQELLRALSIPDVKQRFQNAWIDTVGSSPAEFTAVIKSETEKYGKVIKNAGLGGT